ncbi:hypothetical protein [Streptococcus sp. FT1-55]
MKKLFNWIWAKPKKEEPQIWTIERDGWEAGAHRYDDMIAKLDREVG